MRVAALAVTLFLLYDRDIDKGGIPMGKAMIIGAGGVASVAVHKCCQNFGGL